MRIQKIVVFAFCLFVLSGCGVLQDNEEALSNIEVQETDVEENNPEESDDRGTSEVSVEEDTLADEYEPENCWMRFLPAKFLQYLTIEMSWLSCMTSCRMMRMIGSVILSERGLTWIMMVKTSKL